jgi:GTPase
MFLDHVHLIVQAGSGGNGCASYYHRTDRKSTPNGGDGGKGGSIVFKADENAPGLEHFKFNQHIVGEHGGKGSSNKCRGRNGGDTVVLVPVGTKIYDRERKFLIRELRAPGDQVVVVEGGQGGVGNQGGKDATTGSPGAVLDIELIYRLPADVFLVGLPNSGKTTLLNFLTRSNGKVETYPFTTQTPQIGVHYFSDYEKISICDLPSVYSASHEGRGRGLGFLAHLETASLILYVVDPISEFSSSISEGVKMLREQVSSFNKELDKIPYAVVINKMDLPEAKEALKPQKIRFSPRFPISALTGEGVMELKEFLKQTFLEK